MARLDLWESIGRQGCGVERNDTVSPVQATMTTSQQLVITAVTKAGRVPGSGQGVGAAWATCAAHRLQAADDAPRQLDMVGAACCVAVHVSPPPPASSPRLSPCPRPARPASHPIRLLAVYCAPGLSSFPDADVCRWHAHHWSMVAGSSLAVSVRHPRAGSICRRIASTADDQSENTLFTHFAIRFCIDCSASYSSKCESPAL